MTRLTGDKTVLVTGGAGFIGSHFIRLLLNKQPTWNVINLDALTYAGNLDNLKDIDNNPNYDCIIGNVAILKDVDFIFRAHHSNYVVHFAAETHVDNSIINSEKCVTTNVLGTSVLLECAKKYGVEKFLYVSTDEVYGSLGSEGQFTEKSPLAPNNPYSASKAGGELLCRSFYKTHDFPILITRSSNNYGPNQFPEKLIPLFIKKLLANEKVPVYGSGLAIRDWIYVTDNCKGILKVLIDGKIGEAYNIGGDNELTNLQITYKLLALLNKDESYVKFVDERPGCDYRYSLSTTKIKTELNWSPETNFFNGLAHTVEWSKNNSSINP